MQRSVLGAAIAIFAATALAKSAPAQLSDSFSNYAEHPAINYHSAPSDDAVARLNRQLAAGQIQLRADGPSGYLHSVLAALNVPIESQVAVFAKDSAQSARISRQNPRTLFFNDTVAVGWVRGGFIELAAQDATQGVVFYVMNDRPEFTRRDDCLSCHYSYSTAGVPGMLARSRRAVQRQSHARAREAVGRLVRDRRRGDDSAPRQHRAGLGL